MLREAPYILHRQQTVKLHFLLCLLVAFAVCEREMPRAGTRDRRSVDFFNFEKNSPHTWRIIPESSPVISTTEQLFNWSKSRNYDPWMELYPGRFILKKPFVFREIFIRPDCFGAARASNKKWRNSSKRFLLVWYIF